MRSPACSGSGCARFEGVLPQAGHSPVRTVPRGLFDTVVFFHRRNEQARWNRGVRLQAVGKARILVDTECAFFTKETALGFDVLGKRILIGCRIPIWSAK